MDELYPGDPNYPALLGAIPSPPTLYVRGAVTVDDALALAIVGARDATPYGVEVAERLAGELGARGVTIVSGLARGIDAAAHRGALDAGGRTLAVLGCGIDVVYPPENRALARTIEAQGALVSQFARGAPARAGAPRANCDTSAPCASIVRASARFSGGYTTSMPHPRTASVRPPASSAPRCAAASMPRARPLTIVTPRAPSSPASRSATSTPYGVASRAPTIASASASSTVTAPRT